MAQYPKMSFRVDAKLKRRIEREAEKLRVTAGTYIRNAVIARIENKDVKP